jgi:hypothetical protein
MFLGKQMCLKTSFLLKAAIDTYVYKQVEDKKPIYQVAFSA